MAFADKFTLSFQSRAVCGGCNGFRKLAVLHSETLSSPLILLLVSWLLLVERLEAVPKEGDSIVGASAVVDAVGFVAVFCSVAAAVDFVAAPAVLIQQINSLELRLDRRDSDCNLTALCRESLSNSTLLRVDASFDNIRSFLDRQLNSD